LQINLGDNVWKRLITLSKKEFIQLTRDRRTLIALFFSPLMTLVIFATSVHTDIKHIPMVIADQSMSSSSNAYIHSFFTSGSFDDVARVPDERSVRQFIDSGKAKIGIVILPDFAKKFERGEAHVLMLIDGSTSYTTQTAYSTANAISQQYSVSIMGGAIKFPLNAHLQVLFNPDMKDLWFVTPAFIAVLMQVAAMNLTSFAVVREREAGTIEAILVTPIRPLEFILGKTLPNLAVAFCIGSLLTIFSVLVFRIPFLGNIWLFCALALVSACGGLGLGLVISTAVQTLNQSVQLTSLVNISCMFLSGVLFPSYSMPLVLRIVGLIFPATFSVPLMRGLLLKGLGPADLGPQIGALIILTIITIFLATRLFRQNME
jgi:ABC-2 type transport system permease protein